MSESPTTQALLDSAVATHRAGHLDEAEVLYQGLLEKDESNAAVMHLLGVLYHQQGADSRSADLISRSLAMRPNAPTVHADLAEAYRGLGQLERAVGSCRLALQLWPNCWEALCNLGLALQQLGRREEALDHLRRAAELCPGHAPLHNNLGVLLKEIDHADEALEHFRRAVELDPAFAPARANLGQLLVDRGLPEEAVRHFEEAARLQPEIAAIHYGLGRALIGIERWVGARAALLNALRLEPEWGLAHGHLGLTLLREFRPWEALPWIQRAVELEPHNPQFQEWMGELHVEMDDPASAIPFFQRASTLLDDMSPAVHLSLGQALVDEGRLEEAENHYQAALRLAPQSPLPLTHLGALHEIRGAMTEAEDAFRQALRLQPRAPIALAQLAILLGKDLPEADQAALESRLEDPGLNKRPRARLLFALANVFDARRDYSRAAVCLREANALSLGLAIGCRQHDPAAHERFMQAVVDAFDSGFFARTSGFGLESRALIFVFGLPRSGTTLVEQILSSHSLVYGMGEARLAQRCLQAFMGTTEHSGTLREKAAGLDVEEVRGLALRQLDWIRESCGGSSERIVEKTPGSFVHLGLLATLFPQATFIHYRRDLRDVALSCWMTDFRMIDWANSPEHIASQFHQYRRLVDHWRSVLPVEIHDVEYSDTVTDLESVARRLTAACGLDFEPAWLDFHLTKRPVRTASVLQVRRPIYRRSIDRWKNYESELADLFALLPDPVERPRETPCVAPNFDHPSPAPTSQHA